MLHARVRGLEDLFGTPMLTRSARGGSELTEIGRRLVRGPQMDRDVYFLATTSEELGLLGAHAFAESAPALMMSVSKIRWRRAVLGRVDFIVQAPIIAS